MPIFVDGLGNRVTDNDPAPEVAFGVPQQGGPTGPGGSALGEQIRQNMMTLGFLRSTASLPQAAPRNPVQAPPTLTQQQVTRASDVSPVQPIGANAGAGRTRRPGGYAGPAVPQHPPGGFPGFPPQLTPLYEKPSAVPLVPLPPQAPGVPRPVPHAQPFAPRQPKTDYERYMAHLANQQIAKLRGLNAGQEGGAAPQAAAQPAPPLSQRNPKQVPMAEHANAPMPQQNAGPSGPAQQAPLQSAPTVPPRNRPRQPQTARQTSAPIAPNNAGQGNRPAPLAPIQSGPPLPARNHTAQPQFAATRPRQGQVAGLVDYFEDMGKPQPPAPDPRHRK
jgi:hypothetical protein